MGNDMKKLLPIFLFVAATSLHAEVNRDSVDEIALRKQLWMNHCDDPEYQWDQSDKKWREKNEIKGSWRWDYWEWINDFQEPEYYKSDEFGSNGGWCIG